MGEFKCLIHDTALGPEQKLTALSNYLTLEDRKLLTDVGGGGQSYKYALKTLKKVCGRRDLISREQKIEIGQMSLKGKTAMVFYEYALKVRIHLYEFHRLGEVNPTDIIADVCSKFPQEEQDTWKRTLRGREEFRTLKEFAHWLFERALDKPSIGTLLEEWYEKNRSRPEVRPGRTHQLAMEKTRPVQGGPNREERGKGPVFRRGENLRLANCQSFRNDSVEERKRLK